MLGWIAGAIALVAVIVAGVNLDYIKKTETYTFVSDQLHSTGGAASSILSSMQTTSSMKISSTAFEDGSSIPASFTCDAPSPISPPLQISGVPQEAKSLVLIMDDPDVPKALRPDGVFDHWVVFNLPPSTTHIEEGATPANVGLNGSGKSTYAGPCPPREYEPSEHRYVFTLYALDIDGIKFEQAPTKAEVLETIKGHIITEAQLIGKYKRP